MYSDKVSLSESTRGLAVDQREVDDAEGPL